MPVAGKWIPPSRWHPDLIRLVIIDVSIVTSVVADFSLRKAILQGTAATIGTRRGWIRLASEIQF